VTDFTPRNVLVTGGAGFIGCNFVRQLLRDQDLRTLVTLDLLTYAGRIENLDDLRTESRHRFVHGDIRDSRLVERLLREHEIDTIVHFAAESHVDRSIASPRAFVETNVFGTSVLLDAARAVWLRDRKWTAAECRFHHISTDEVYGSLGPSDPPFTEDTPYAPNSPYAASKASADHLVRSYHRTYGLPVVTTNCSNNYGPYQNAEKFIPTVVYACLEGRPIPVYGDGGNMRDWLYVVDHCRAVERVLRQGRVGETYVIGGGAERRNVDIARQICTVLADVAGRPPQEFTRLISYVADRPGHDRRYAINPAKIRGELGWAALETFESGIRKTIEWYHAPHAGSASSRQRPRPPLAARES